MDFGNLKVKVTIAHTAPGRQISIKLKFSSYLLLTYYSIDSYHCCFTYRFSILWYFSDRKTFQRQLEASFFPV